MPHERDLRAIVEAGYGAVSDLYADLASELRAWPRLEWLGRLLERLRPGPGCSMSAAATLYRPRE
jgi:hypothetical protein